MALAWRLLTLSLSDFRKSYGNTRVANSAKRCHHKNVATMLCGHLVNFSWESCGSNVRASWVDCSIHCRNLFFPQLRMDILATPIAKSQASPYIRQLFHQSTALIITTSFIDLFLSDCFCESLCVCENLNSFPACSRRRKSSDRCISTA